MTTENVQTSTPASPASNGTALEGAFASLAAAKGFAPADTPATNIVDGTTVEGAQPAGSAQPTDATPPPAATPPAAPGDRERDLLARVANKDRLLQEARNNNKSFETRLAQLEQQHTSALQAAEQRYQELVNSLRSDPLTTIKKHGATFTDIAHASLALDGQQPAPGQQPSQKTAEFKLPAEVQKELDDLRSFKTEAKSFIDELKADREKSASRSQLDQQVSIVKNHLSSRPFPLLNDEGNYEDVLKLVGQHVGQHGAFADEKEAAEIVEFYAGQIEKELEAKARALLAKPGYKSLLGKELGAVQPAKPARQEIQGETSQRTRAPALTHDLASQRTEVAPPAEWNFEAAKKQAIADMNATLERVRSGQR